MGKKISRSKAKQLKAKSKRLRVKSKQLRTKKLRTKSKQLKIKSKKLRTKYTRNKRVKKQCGGQDVRTHGCRENKEWLERNYIISIPKRHAWNSMISELSASTRDTYPINSFLLKAGYMELDDWLKVTSTREGTTMIKSAVHFLESMCVKDEYLVTNQPLIFGYIKSNMPTTEQEMDGKKCLIVRIEHPWQDITGPAENIWPIQKAWTNTHTRLEYIRYTNAPTGEIFHNLPETYVKYQNENSSGTTAYNRWLLLPGGAVNPNHEETGNTYDWIRGFLQFCIKEIKGQSTSPQGDFGLEYGETTFGNFVIDPRSYQLPVDAQSVNAKCGEYITLKTSHNPEAQKRNPLAPSVPSVPVPTPQQAPAQQRVSAQSKKGQVFPEPYDPDASKRDPTKISRSQQFVKAVTAAPMAQAAAAPPVKRVPPPTVTTADADSVPAPFLQEEEDDVTEAIGRELNEVIQNDGLQGRVKLETLLQFLQHGVQHEKDLHRIMTEAEPEWTDDKLIETIKGIYYQWDLANNNRQRITKLIQISHILAILNEKVEIMNETLREIAQDKYEDGGVAADIKQLDNSLLYRWFKDQYGPDEVYETIDTGSITHADVSEILRTHRGEQVSLVPTTSSPGRTAVGSPRPRSPRGNSVSPASSASSSASSPTPLLASPTPTIGTRPLEDLI